MEGYSAWKTETVTRATAQGNLGTAGGGCRSRRRRTSAVCSPRDRKWDGVTSERGRDRELSGHRAPVREDETVPERVGAAPWDYTERQSLHVQR